MRRAPARRVGAFGSNVARDVGDGPAPYFQCRVGPLGGVCSKSLLVSQCSLAPSRQDILTNATGRVRPLTIGLADDASFIRPLSRSVQSTVRSYDVTAAEPAESHVGGVGGVAHNGVCLVQVPSLVDVEFATLGPVGPVHPEGRLQWRGQRLTRVTA